MAKISNEIRSRLRGELITLYPSVRKALVIIGDIEMPQDKLDINSSTKELWESILLEAEKHNKVKAIVEIALKEYPSQNTLKEVLLEINEVADILHEDIRDHWGKTRRLIDSGELSASLEKAEDFIQTIQSYVQTEIKKIRSDFETLNSQNANLENFKKEKAKLLERLNKSIFEKLNDKYFTEDLESNENIRSVPRGKVQVELEKIVGQSPFRNNQVSMSWLTRGIRASNSVVLVKIGNGSMGTGFILKGGFLLTANYIIPKKSEIENVIIEAGYNERRDQSVYYKLDSSIFYYEDSIDDNNYSLLKIIDKPQNPIQEYGYLEIEDLIELLPGDNLSIIQHPHGEKKKVSFSDNELIEMKGNELIYKASTFPGSGGAPLLNQDWKVIGMHLKAVMSSTGKIEPNIKAGISIKAIIKDLKSKIPKDQIESFPFLNSNTR